MHIFDREDVAAHDDVERPPALGAMHAVRRGFV
jgi:hypothetical protein